MAIATGATLDLGLSHVVGLYFQNFFMAFTERYRTCATPCGEDAKYAADDAPEWKRTFSRVVFLETWSSKIERAVHSTHARKNRTNSEGVRCHRTSIVGGETHNKSEHASSHIARKSRPDIKMPYALCITRLPPG